MHLLRVIETSFSRWCIRNLLVSALPRLHLSNTDRKSIIKQLDSWNHILATSSAMNRLLAHFDVFPQFLDHLHSFGLRINAVAEDLPTISIQHNSVRSNLFEVCYDIRYPEKNGRGFGDPWSIRHTAVYYQYDSSKDTSMSLLIQPSKVLARQIDVLLTGERPVSCRSILIQHATFVSSGTSWKYFVADMEKELNALVCAPLHAQRPSKVTNFCRKRKHISPRLEFQVSMTTLWCLKTTKTRNGWGRSCWKVVVSWKLISMW